MTKVHPISLVAAFALVPLTLAAQQPPSQIDPRIYGIVDSVRASRVEADIRRLVGFGTRNTLSDTLSPARGIGAARRWIKAEFDRISQACGGCLDVYYVGKVYDMVRRQRDPGTRRLSVDTVSVNVVNVVAVQRGTTDPNRFAIMSGDIDSRISSTWNATDSAPGANDNASGVAGTLEAARVLTKYRFNGSIAYLALSGEEQGLYGGQTVARMAKDKGWHIVGMLNDDMIGNIAGVDGVVDNTTARVFSDGHFPIEQALGDLRTDTTQGRGDSTVTVDARRFFELYGRLSRMRREGGDVDGPSRQLARYIDHVADLYLPTLDVMMVYRLDRFGRGGHQSPFANEGYPAVRVMEAHENYTRQHQDIRVENGIHYGDVLEGVNFDYARKLTALNAATLAALAWAPSPPQSVRIAGAVQPAATLRWDAPLDSANVIGYRVYWRRTDQPTWESSAWVGSATAHRFEGLVIDNYFFGVAAVGRDGNESPVAFPEP